MTDAKLMEFVFTFSDGAKARVIGTDRMLSLGRARLALTRYGQPTHSGRPAHVFTDYAVVPVLTCNMAPVDPAKNVVGFARHIRQLEAQLRVEADAKVKSRRSKRAR